MTEIEVEHKDACCIAWRRNIPNRCREGWMVPYEDHGGDKEAAEADARAQLMAREVE